MSGHYIILCGRTGQLLRAAWDTKFIKYPRKSDDQQIHRINKLRTNTYFCHKNFILGSNLKHRNYPHTYNTYTHTHTHIYIYGKLILILSPRLYAHGSPSGFLHPRFPNNMVYANPTLPNCKARPQNLIHLDSITLLIYGEAPN